MLCRPALDVLAAGYDFAIVGEKQRDPRLPGCFSREAPPFRAVQGCREEPPAAAADDFRVAAGSSQRIERITAWMPRAERLKGAPADVELQGRAPASIRCNQTGTLAR